MDGNNKPIHLSMNTCKYKCSGVNILTEILEQTIIVMLQQQKNHMNNIDFDFFQSNISAQVSQDGKIIHQKYLNCVLSNDYSERFTSLGPKLQMFLKQAQKCTKRR